jgi:hypothetical protein
MKDIIEMILNNPFIVVGANIPKPRGHKCTILNIHENNEKPFLKYCTGNSKKTISKAEFRGAYQRLLDNNSFTKQWFNKHFPTKAGCNFTSIGGVFEKLGIAKYIKNGCYQLIQPQNN